MANKFYVLLLQTAPRQAPRAAIEQALNDYDWLRLSSTQYVIYGAGTATDIYNRIKPILHKDDTFIVMEASDNRHGWVPKVAADWFNKSRL